MATCLKTKLKIYSTNAKAIAGAVYKETDRQGYYIGPCKHCSGWHIWPSDWK
jgi:hypothetical protein